MKQTNAVINHRELYITLDYLLNHTDEKHPATQMEICEFALREHGDLLGPKQIIRRQRIKVCLQFLHELSQTGKPPFVIEMTDGGKYYLEEKHSLMEGQVAQLISAINNDKYTDEGNSRFLKGRILDTFATDYSKDRILKEAEKLSKGVHKRQLERNYRLLHKAYEEARAILVSTETGKPSWYRVYDIKERHNRLFCFLIPIKSTDDFVYATLDRLVVAPGKDKEVLREDEPGEDRLTELYKRANGKYLNPKKHLERTKLPLKGKVAFASFYFNLKDLNTVKHSFEDFFGLEMEYKETGKPYDPSLDGFGDELDSFVIVTVDEGEPKKYGLVNIEVDDRGLLAWLLSDPFCDGQYCIADFVKVVKPVGVRPALGAYFLRHLVDYVEDLSERNKDAAFELGVRIVNKLAPQDPLDEEVE